MREHYRRRDKRLSIDLSLDERQQPENLVKTYPSIPYATECRVPIVAFDKLDGSNVRIEWSKKKGFYKFGTRKRLLDETDVVFGVVPDILEKKIGPALSKALDDAGFDRVMCFFEFHGKNSFAGMHDPNDEMQLTLIDVAPFKLGLLDPERFLKLFGHLNVPRVLYTGEVTPDFIESVRSSTLEGMTFEGVVCKGKNDKKTKAPIMFKQKSKAWLDKLHSYCGDNYELFRTLL